MAFINDKKRKLSDASGFKVTMKDFSWTESFGYMWECSTSFFICWVLLFAAIGIGCCACCYPFIKDYLPDCNCMKRDDKTFRSEKYKSKVINEERPRGDGLTKYEYE